MSIRKFNHLYLHGFASGPASTKAEFFRAKAESEQANFAVPDLNQPSFYQMTITGQIDLARSVVAKLSDRPIIVWGSSMGGLVASLLAQKSEADIRGLILLAPGFDLTRRWQELMGQEKLEEWRSEGSFPFFHYGLKRDEKLSYGFFEDCLTYQTGNLKIDCPTIIFHGVNDQTVPIDQSRRFVSNNPTTAHLFELNDGHELVESLDFMWKESRRFIEQLAALKV